MAYQSYIWEYLCGVNSYVTLASLNNSLSYEALGGGGVDISMIRFKLWEPLYW